MAAPPAPPDLCQRVLDECADTDPDDRSPPRGVAARALATLISSTAPQSWPSESSLAKLTGPALSRAITAVDLTGRGFILPSFVAVSLLRSAQPAAAVECLRTLGGVPKHCHAQAAGVAAEDDMQRSDVVTDAFAVDNASRLAAAVGQDEWAALGDDLVAAGALPEGYVRALSALVRADSAGSLPSQPDLVDTSPTPSASAPGTPLDEESVLESQQSSADVMLTCLVRSRSTEPGFARGTVVPAPRRRAVRRPRVCDAGSERHAGEDKGKDNGKDVAGDPLGAAGDASGDEGAEAASVGEYPAEGRSPVKRARREPQVAPAPALWPSPRKRASAFKPGAEPRVALWG